MIQIHIKNVSLYVYRGFGEVTKKDGCTVPSNKTLDNYETEQLIIPIIVFC